MPPSIRDFHHSLKVVFAESLTSFAKSIIDVSVPDGAQKVQAVTPIFSSHELMDVKISSDVEDFVQQFNALSTADLKYLCESVTPRCIEIVTHYLSALDDDTEVLEAHLRVGFMSSMTSHIHKIVPRDGRQSYIELKLFRIKSQLDIYRLENVIDLIADNTAISILYTMSLHTKWALELQTSGFAPIEAPVHARIPPPHLYKSSRNDSKTRTIIMWSLMVFISIILLIVLYCFFMRKSAKNS